jgi:glycosyltransferase involved in cell wall biosynthesis
MEYGTQKIPVVCSPVGAYQGFVKHEKTGFLASRTADWIKSLETLIENKKKRKDMGEQLYQDISKSYTIDTNIYKYINFFKQLCTEGTK